MAIKRKHANEVVFVLPNHQRVHASAGPVSSRDGPLADGLYAERNLALCELGLRRGGASPA